MQFLQELKEYLKEKEGFETSFSDFLQKPSGDGIVYINCVCPVHGKCTLRCKFTQIMGETRLSSIKPMVRLSESQFPWDSTIKSVYSLYNGIAGVGGVGHRTVNNSLI
jgi:hypothetical protein